MNCTTDICWLITWDDCFAFLFYLLSMSVLITVCRVIQFLEADIKILDKVLLENMTMTRIFCALFYLLSMSVLITVCRVIQFLEADIRILDKVLVEYMTMTRIFCALFYKLHYVMYTFTERNGLVICM
jgi:hypothetical protein